MVMSTAVRARARRGAARDADVEGTAVEVEPKQLP